MNRGRKKNNNKKNKGPSRMTLSTIPRPPKYMANTYVNKKWRYQYSFIPANGNKTFNITPSKFGFLNTVAATTVLGVGLYEQVMIKRISLFATPPVDGSVIDIGVIWNSAALGIQGDDILHSAQSYGMTEGAVVVSKPPKKSQASQWQGCTTGATNLWFTLQFSTLNAGVGGIIITIDIDCSLRCTSDTRTSANTIALTTATVSDFYYMALDNVAPGGSVGNVLIPDRSLNTTV